MRRHRKTNPLPHAVILNGAERNEGSRRRAKDGSGTPRAGVRSFAPTGAFTALQTTGERTDEGRRMKDEHQALNTQHLTPEHLPLGTRKGPAREERGLSCGR